MIEIESLDDPRLAPYRNLRRGRDEADGLFVVEGRWLAERLLDSDFEVHSLLVEQRRRDDLAGRTGDAPLYVIPDKAAPELVGFDFHRGVLACGRRPARLRLDQLLLAGKTATVAVCCRITDPENLGLLFRNSTALGADAVVLGPACADPLSRRVLRVSMGNVFWMPFAVCESLEQAVAELRAEGFDVAATVLDADAVPLAEAGRRPRQALVFGEEAHGIRDAVADACSRRLTIPMSNGADSLNVAVASGVFLYWARQAGPSDGK